MCKEEIDLKFMSGALMFSKLFANMAKRQTFKPGEIAPRSGQYAIVGPHGGRTGIEWTVVRGESLPPTLDPGQRYVIVDPTKTKGK